MYRMAETRVIDNVWRLSMLQPADRTENLGYPTQKPETVLERVIKAASNPGDLVLDCFMGSGTTQAVALRMGRRFIGCDINLGAIQTATRRLINLGNELRVQKGRQATLLEGGQAVYAGFNVYNVNNYDVFRSPTQARELLLEALEIQPLQAGGLYDGEKDGRMVKIMPINRIATRQDLNELINNFNYRLFEKRKKDNPRQPVEKLLLICMGHEPDLKAALVTQVDYELDVEVVDILRDSDHLQFRRDSDARLVVRKNKVLITAFYPMNLLQKLSVMKEDVGEWRELVDSVMIDFNYDGAVLQPTVVDVPEDGKLVAGSYDIPPDAGTIRVKITDVLSESWEGEVTLG
jgi:site-specific DNA-methyltransferase (adenine-specific)/adenine-specific DNA-methyltransferase